jgi:hypothetical protein
VGFLLQLSKGGKPKKGKKGDINDLGTKVTIFPCVMLRKQPRFMPLHVAHTALSTFYGAKICFVPLVEPANALPPKPI